MSKRKRSASTEAENEPIDTSKRIRGYTVSLSRLSDEVILQVLSFMDATGLCAFQCLNHRMAALATDPLLWKTLYQKSFQIGFRMESGESLPAVPTSQYIRQMGHNKQEDRRLFHGIDWKRRYQVRSNWTRGRCRAYRDPKKVDFGQRSDQQGHSLKDGKLYVNGALQTGLKHRHFKVVMPVGTRTLLLLSDEAASIYCLDFGTILDKVVLPPYLHHVIHEGLLAILTTGNQLLLYDLTQQLQTIISLKGTDLTRVQLNMRTIAGAIALSLIMVENGIVGSTLRVQEIMISRSSRCVQSMRSAVSFMHGNSRAFDTTVPLTANSSGMIYEHPYILIPVENSIYLHKVHTTPTSLTITPPQLLWGYGSAIKSCSINRPLRFVVGTGTSGTHVWDMRFENGSRGISVPISFKDTVDGTGHDYDSDDWDTIQVVSESKIVSRSQTDVLQILDFAT